MKNLIAKAILLSLLLSSCASLQNVNQKQINGRQVAYTTAGEGSPSIVLETGMGPSMETWTPILDSLSSLTRTFAYNRPGYNQSSIHQPPKDAKAVAQQLHENLEATQQSPPYILVGHSAGGLYINMFARLYPEEVAGLVFLDASHPDQFEYFRTDQTLLYNMLVTACTKGDRKYELSIVKTTQAVFADAPPFPEVPIAVLTAGKKSSPLESEKLRTQWLVFQADLAALSPDSKHIIVENSGHYIHKDNPQMVIQEITQIWQRSNKQLTNQ